jgi:hypothetical protein
MGIIMTPEQMKELALDATLKAYDHPAPQPARVPLTESESDCNKQLIEAIHDCKRLDRLLQSVLRERNDALANTHWLTVDDAETELSIAIHAQSLQMRTDDKLILNVLRSRGVWLARRSEE